MNAYLVRDQVIAQLIIEKEHRHIHYKDDQEDRNCPDEDMRQNQPPPYFPEKLPANYGKELPEVVNDGDRKQRCQEIQGACAGGQEEFSDEDEADENCSEEPHPRFWNQALHRPSTGKVLVYAVSLNY
jgi:hypothetical protein